jgi:NAD(P)-dependent dehydrogenase (short-subunit alcohol dehydrogenase family)
MKTVLITGASRGIGRATAEKFLAEGWFVIGTSTSGKIDIDSPNLSVVQLDLSNSKSIAGAIVAVKTLGIDVDVLVNNAGINVEEWEELVLDVGRLRETLEVNLIGTVDFTEKVITAFSSIENIVNISSMSGALGDENDGYMPAYKISKVALNMYTRTLATRLKEKSVTVSSVDPGWVKTDMGGDEAPDVPEKSAKEIFELATGDFESGFFWREGKKRDW